jgi:hypothetical protein
VQRAKHAEPELKGTSAMSPLPSYDQTTRRSEQTAFLVLGLAGIAAISLAVSVPSGAAGGEDWESATPASLSMSVASRQACAQADCPTTNWPTPLPGLKTSIKLPTRFEAPFFMRK